MPIDTSMYGQKNPIMDSFMTGATIGDMFSRGREKREIKNAFSKNMSPDGTLNQESTLRDLAKIDPEKAMAYKQQFLEQDNALRKSKYEEMGQKLTMSSQLLGSAYDQNSWSKNVAQAEQMGLVRPGELPQQYDPNLRDSLMARTMSAKERFDLQYKDRELAIKEKEAGAKNSQEVGKLATELRKERSGLQTTKATQEVSVAYNKIQSAAQKVSPAGDMSLIFNYMKMLDPGSTVREGEYANASQATNVPGGVLNMYNKAVNGQLLNPIQRKDFVDQAGGLYKSQLDIQQQVDSQFSNLAQQAGINPNDVILNFEANQPRGKKEKTTFKTSEIEWAE